MFQYSSPLTRSAGFGLLCSLGVLTLAGAGSAQNIETGNAASIFAGKTVGVSSTFPASQFSAANLVNGSPSSFVFADGNATEYANISGFTVAVGQAITSLRFFDEPGFNSRTSPSVTIYSSATGVTVLDPTNSGYKLVGTFQLPGTYAPNSPDQYLTVTSPADTSTNGNGGTINFDTLTGLNIGAGTKSLLFSFAQDTNFINGPGGTSLSELQGFVSAAPAPEPSQAAALAVGILSLGVLALKARKRGASRAA